MPPDKNAMKGKESEHLKNTSSYHIKVENWWQVDKVKKNGFMSLLILFPVKIKKGFYVQIHL